MVAVQRAEAVNQKVWLIIGEETGLYQATIKYLRSRGQTVLSSPGLDRLAEASKEILKFCEYIDKLVINDVKRDTHLPSLFENVYTISTRMRKDGSGQVIFLLSNERCFTRLEKTDAYRKLKKDMQHVLIHVRCFESC